MLWLWEQTFFLILKEWDLDIKVIIRHKIKKLIIYKKSTVLTKNLEIDFIEKYQVKVMIKN